jgi:hypothetical protein
VSHRNARLTLHGRRLLISRVAAGRPVAHVAAELGISRATGPGTRPGNSHVGVFGPWGIMSGVGGREAKPRSRAPSRGGSTIG